MLHNVQRAQQGKPLCDFKQLCLESLWDLPGKSVKIKHPGTFLGNNPLLSLEHWPLWLAWARWPCPIPFHQHSGQCEQKTGTLIRDAQMGRSWWQTVSCPSSSMRPLCLLHTQWGYTLQEGVNTDSVRQTKTSFVLRRFSDFFLAAYLFNFLRGGRGLPYLRLFIPANRLVAFCLQVTHPEVTFNSWTKKCVVMLYGTASQPEEITNTVNATELHSWPVVRASRQPRRERGIQHTLLHWFESYVTSSHARVGEMNKNHR